MADHAADGLGYAWDILLSYGHDGTMDMWVPDHLVPFLKTFVGNAVNRPISIFVDRSGISAGDAWPERLRNALGRTRCLVAVWNPLYFHSDWCRQECAVMMHREKRMSYRTLTRPRGLIVPVNVYDGIFFPPPAQVIQTFDLQKYWIAGPAFRDSVLYVEFQTQLKVLAGQIASAVAGAPPWEESFMDAACLNVSTDDLMPPSSTNFAFPGTD